MSLSKCLWAAISLCCLSSFSNAQNLSASYIGMNQGQTLQASFDGGTSIYNMSAGLLEFQGFNAFCVDPWQPINTNTAVEYQIQSFDSLTRSDVVAHLVGAYLDSPQTSLDAAAVQWAIWETIADSFISPSLSGGQVQITDPTGIATIERANFFLANFHSYTPASLTYIKNDNYQDYVVWAPIPEPSSALLLSLSALFLFRRKR